MKKLIAIALLTASVQAAPLQAQDIPQQKTWTTHSAQSYSQGNSVPSKPQKYEQQLNQRPQRKPLSTSYSRPQRKPVANTHSRPQRQSAADHYSRPNSLHQADYQIERLEQRQHRLKRELHQAKRRHASRSEIRRLSDALFRVDQHLQSAKRDYRHFLKIKLGSRQFTQLIKHSIWLSGHR